ncbi:MAG: hypothetical protein K1X64_11455 [Myxococcaceae bacterium]|nr:hypothetical protein [Myxococcaceae bacterium]
MRPDELEPMPGALQSLLDAERSAGGMPSAVRNRLLERLGTEIFAGAVAGTAVASASTAQAAAPTVSVATAPAAVTAGAAPVAGVTKAVMVKWLVGVGVAALATGGVVGVEIGENLSNNRSVSIEERAVPVPVGARPPAPVEVAPSAAIAAAPERAAPVVKPVAPRVAPSAPVQGDALGIERSLLEQARTALSRGNAVDALSALNQHEKKFPRGQMAEERAAMQVLTLKALGRFDEARQRAEVFRAQYPKGLFRASVDAAVSDL